MFPSFIYYMLSSCLQSWIEDDNNDDDDAYVNDEFDDVE